MKEEGNPASPRARGHWLYSVMLLPVACELSLLHSDSISSLTIPLVRKHHLLKQQDAQALHSLARSSCPASWEWYPTLPRDEDVATSSFHRLGPRCLSFSWPNINPTLLNLFTLRGTSVSGF